MYPDFCKDCDKVETCNQKVFMLAGTEPKEGFTVFPHGEHFCADCIPETMESSEPLDGVEMDYPAHCSNCGIPLCHELTVSGVEYIKECLESQSGCCREVWPTVWADYLN